MILNVYDFLAKELKYLPVDIEIQGVEFEVIPLDDDLIEEAKGILTSELLINFVADNSVSFKGKRLLGNVKALLVVEKLWLHKDMPKTNPTVRAELGKEVIGLSGLGDYFDDMVADEINQNDVNDQVKALKEQGFIKGDVPLSTFNGIKLEDIEEFALDNDLLADKESENTSPEKLAQDAINNAAA